MSNPTSASSESATALNSRLLQRYAQAVDQQTLQLLTQDTRLSGLFVAAASESYVRSKVRLMIVGRETAGWAQPSGVSAPDGEMDVKAYLHHQMLHHAKKVAEVKSISTFFQFYRRAAQIVAAPEDRHAKDAPVWANLFCVDAKRSRPDRAPGAATSRILELSASLLRIQIAVLKPQLIIFATGSSCDSYLKTSYFGGLQDSKVHIPKRLWEFKISLPDDCGNSHVVRAFRTPHPRHRGSDAARAAAVAESVTPGAIKRYMASASGAGINNARLKHGIP